MNRWALWSAWWCPPPPGPPSGKHKESSMDREVIHVGKSNTAILRGEADLSSWSEEELIRGQKRSASGRWQGRPPKVVPKALHDELVKRKMSKAYELLS